MRIRHALLQVGLMGSIACGGDSATTPQPVTPAPVASVTVSGAPDTLEVGETAQLAALLKDAANKTLTGRTVTWSSNDTTRATVSASGLVAAVGQGPVSITATSEGVTGGVGIATIFQLLTQVPNGFHGYVSGWFAGFPAGYEYGVSFYSSIFAMTPVTVDQFQMGLTSTWLTPNNFDFASPLCPMGTYARDNWPERGAYQWRDVFQTIEGGAGYWVSTHFKSTLPKYRINTVPDCYDSQLSSTGWGFGNSSPTPDTRLGVVQLSNRLPVIPDGFTYGGSPNGALLGQMWVALPLVPSYQTPGGVTTGEQSWTLFLNAANFSGPVAFVAPGVYARIVELDASIQDRTLDVRRITAGALSMEIAEAPMFEAADGSTTVYRKIPEFVFPVDANGRTVLAQDIRALAKIALHDAVADWIPSPSASAPTQLDPAGVQAVSFYGTDLGIQIGSERTPLDVTGMVQTTTFTTTGGGNAFGLQWIDTGLNGHFPQYHRDEGDHYQSVPLNDVPVETSLAVHDFRRASSSGSYDVSTGASSAWSSANWAAGPFSISLNDGSTVEYVWYRFVDQPAIARIPLTVGQRNTLQAWAAAMHAKWAPGLFTQPAPTSGTLVSLESVQLVTPPAGMEVGYVPIVISQH